MMSLTDCPFVGSGAQFIFTKDTANNWDPMLFTKRLSLVELNSAKRNISQNYKLILTEPPRPVLFLALGTIQSHFTFAWSLFRVKIQK